MKKNTQTASKRTGTRATKRAAALPAVVSPPTTGTATPAPGPVVPAPASTPPVVVGSIPVPATGSSVGTAAPTDGLGDGPGDATITSPAPAAPGSTSPASPSAAPAAVPRPVAKGLKGTNSLLKPKGNQATLAPSMATEILQSNAAGTYVVYFGIHAPEATGLAGQLTTCAGATRQEAADEATLATSRNTRNQSWNTLLSGSMQDFETCFNFAVSKDPTIAESFPATVVFLKTNAEISARAVATRKAKKAASTGSVSSGTSGT